MQVLARIYHIVYQTGLYFNACEKWNEKAVADQTYANFKKHILTVQRKNRDVIPAIWLRTRGATNADHDQKFANFVATKQETQAAALAAVQAEKAPAQVEKVTSEASNWPWSMLLLLG